MPDEGLPGPPPRRGIRGRQARPLRRLRRDLRQDVPALSDGPRRPPEARREPPRRRQLARRRSGIAVSAIGLRVRLRPVRPEAGLLPDRSHGDERLRVRRRRPVRRGRLRRERPRLAGDRAPDRLLNARHLLYSAALAPWFAGVPFRARAVAAHLLTDESFALSIAHFRRLGRSDAWGYWFARDRVDVHPLEHSRRSPGVMLGGQILDPARLGHRRHLPGGDDRALGRPHHRPARARRGDRRRRRRRRRWRCRRARRRHHRRRAGRAVGRAAVRPRHRTARTSVGSGYAMPGHPGRDDRCADGAADEHGPRPARVPDVPRDVSVARARAAHALARPPAADRLRLPAARRARRSWRRWPRSP